MTVVRLLLPLTILRWPLAGGILAIVADILDWHIVSPNLSTDSDYAFYQRWDKILDFYYLSLEAWIVLHFKTVWIKRISIAFFLYRFVGVILFEIFQVRALLFVFPNIFEAVYLLYLSFVTFFSNDLIKAKLENAIKMALWVIIPGKLLMEYILHIAPVSLIISTQQFIVRIFSSMTSDTNLKWISLVVGLIVIHYKKRLLFTWVKHYIAQVDKSYHSMVK